MAKAKKIFDTSKFVCEEENLTREEYELLKHLLYDPPPKSEIVRCINNLHDGGTAKTILNKAYINKCRYKVVLYDCPYSIEDILKSYDLTNYVLRYRKKNPDFYDPLMSIEHHFLKAVGTCGAGVCRIATPFPMNTVDQILRKYNVNGKYYDFSCGWGDRLIGSLRNNIDYYGVDPNYELVESLFEMGSMYLKVTCDTTNFSLRAQGSEIFVPEWCNMMGVAFSSPPYFNLEDYKVGKQSYTEGTTYEQWLNNFMLPSMKNAQAYLVDNGYYIINVKNFDGYDLVGDCKRLAKSIGFEFVCNETLINIQRTGLTNELIDNSEIIQVFKKPAGLVNNCGSGILESDIKVYNYNNKMKKLF